MEKDQGRALKSTRVVEVTSVNLKTTSQTEKEFINGLMGKSMMVNGKMV
jgi:hypothetical protein